MLVKTACDRPKVCEWPKLPPARRDGCNLSCNGARALCETVKRSLVAMALRVADCGCPSHQCDPHHLRK